MINKTSIKIAYPLKVGYFSINRTRTINFIFDNFALFLFREKNGINNGEDLAEWRIKHGDYDLMLHALFSAAESEAMQNRKKFDMDLKRFALGFAQADKKEIEKVIEVWKRSQTFGSATIPGKKKVMQKD
jgi:hypothetical protein